MGDVTVQYAPGQRLPGTVYRVVQHLATGGMGSVYEVEDVTVGKRYVVKTLHPELVLRDDLAKRMAAEARTLAKLQHPNIVDVVTAGLTTDGKRIPFYVMERLSGQNLRHILEKKGALEPAHLFRIAIDMLDALDHAHTHSVIHRDVKPDNIFLHRNPNAGGVTTPKLLDFGIMRLLDRKASLTRGKFIGTLRYASPEQIFGGDIGPATDIYSFGLVLYEMIAARGPFDHLGDALAIGAAHAELPPPALSRFSPSVPPALEALVMTCLAKDPRDRPRDCASLAASLRAMFRASSAPPQPMASAFSAVQSAQTVQTTDFIDGNVPTKPVAWSGGEPAQAPAVQGGHFGAGHHAAAWSARPVVDRAAPTRESGVSGFTQRWPTNGTAVDIDPPPLGWLGNARLQPTPSPSPSEARNKPAFVVEARDANASASSSPRHPGAPAGHQHHAAAAIEAPLAGGHPYATGPFAGEARTRPPEPSSFIFQLFAAAAVALLVAAVAALFVMRPWVARRVAEGDSRVSVPNAPPTALPGASAAADPAATDTNDAGATPIPIPEKR